MSKQESAQATIEDKLKEILGEEDWKYTDKPHRIQAIITTETTKAAKKAWAEGYHKGAEAALQEEQHD